MKKLLSIILVICVLMTMASFPAMAQTATNPKRVKIMTIGDSITQGTVNQNAYRYSIYENLIQDGAVFQFIGPFTSQDFRVSSANNLYNRHGGYGGAVIGCPEDYTWNGSKWITSSWSTTDPISSAEITYSGSTNSVHYRLFANTDGTRADTSVAYDSSTDTTVYGQYVADADIVTLLIGYNDYFSTTLGINQEAIERYEVIVDRIYHINPDVSLYIVGLHEIDSLRGYNSVEGTDEYNLKSFRGFNDLLEAFPEYYNEKYPDRKISFISLDAANVIRGVDTPSDDLHPNASGDDKLGDIIYEGIKDEILSLNEIESDESYNPTRVASIALDKTSATLKTGENLTVTSTIAPSDAEIITTIFTSSDESVATVDHYGRITAVGEGTATIKATALDSLRPGATEISATCTVTVTGDTFEKVGANFLPVFADDFSSKGAWTGNTELIATGTPAYKHTTSYASSTITSNKTVDLKNSFSMSFGAAVIGVEAKEVTDANRNAYYSSLKVGKYELRVSINGKVVGFYYDGTLKNERVFATPITKESDDRYSLVKYNETVYVYRNNELLFTSTVDANDTAEGQVIISCKGYITQNLRDVQLKSIYGLVKLDPTAIKYSTSNSFTNEETGVTTTHPIENALDGELSTRYSVAAWKGATPVEWTSDARFVILDLGKEYNVSDLNIYWGAQGGVWGSTMPDAYNVSYSADNSTYTPALSYSGIYDILLGNTTESYSDENTIFAANHPSWATGANANVYGYGSVNESELGWEGVRYIKIEMTSVTYNPTIAEIEVYTTQYMEGEEPDGTLVSYTVNYVDSQGNAIATAKTVNGLTIGEEITENAIEIDGYEADKASETITLKSSGNSITFTYTRVFSAEPVEIAPIGVTSPFTPKSSEGCKIIGVIDGVDSANWGTYFRHESTISPTGTKGNDSNFHFIVDFGHPYNLTEFYSSWGSKYATGVALWGTNDLEGEWTEIADFTLDANKLTKSVTDTEYYRYVKVEAYATQDSNPACLEVTFTGIPSGEAVLIDNTNVTATSGGVALTAATDGINGLQIDVQWAAARINHKDVFEIGDGTSESFSVIVDLGAEYNVDTMFHRWGGTRPTKANIYLSDDGINWGDVVATITPTYTQETVSWSYSTTSLIGGTGKHRYVKIEVTQLNRLGTKNGTNSSGAAEDHRPVIFELMFYEWVENETEQPETPKSATYTVNYVDTEGNPVATAKNGTGYVGDTVTEKAVAVAGYTVDKASETITLIDGTNTITFTYTKNATVEPSKITASSVTADAEAAEGKSANIIDGKPGTYFKTASIAQGNGTDPVLTLNFDLGMPYDITSIDMNWGSCRMATAVVYGANSPDATEWNVIHNFETAPTFTYDSASGGNITSATVESEGYYQYIKFEVLKLNWEGQVAVREITFNGVLDPSISKLSLTTDMFTTSALYTNVSPLTSNTVDVLIDGDFSVNGDDTNTTDIETAAIVFSATQSGEVIIDLGDKYDLASMGIWWGLEESWWAVYAPNDYTVEVSVDGVDYTPVYSVTGATTDRTRDDVVGMYGIADGVQYVKINVTACATSDGAKRAAIREIELYGKEVSGEPDEPDTPDEPTIKPITIAPTGMSAPTSTSGRAFSYATDGDTTTFYAISGYHDPLASTNYQFVFDVGFLGKVDSLDILWGDSSWGNTTPNAYKVEVSSDGKTWTQKKSYSGIYDITTGAATDTISGENTVFGITTSSWAITNQPTQVNAYTQGNVLEKNLGWTDVRYIRVTVTSVQYRLALREVTVSSTPNEDQIIIAKGGQIRIADADNEITAGLRFGASVIKSVVGIEGEYVYSEDADIKFGMFMLPKDMLGSSATLTAYLANGVQNALDVPAKNIYSQDDNFITYTAVLTNIPESEYNTDIVAVPYMLKDGAYTYFDEMTKSYAGVAEAARNTTYSDSAISNATGEEKEELIEIAYQLDCIIKGWDADYDPTTARTVTQTFDFDGSLGSYWKHCPNWVRGDGGSQWTNDMVGFDSDGNLVLSAIWDSSLNSGNGYLRTGAVRTMTTSYSTTYSAGYGYYEARIKFPNDHKGTWTAFWMMAGDVSSTSNGAADGVEIDFIESIHNEAGKCNSALYWDYGELKSANSTYFNHNIYDGNWHTIGCERTAEGYKFFIDGRLMWNVSSDEVAACNKEGYFKLTVEAAPWTIPGGSEDFSVYANYMSEAYATETPIMVIDYVKVYED